MSIASRQVKKELNKIIEERMKDGYIPTIEYLTYKLSDFYSRVNVGTPSFRMRTQAYRKQWNVDNFNSNLSEIYDDINNLYEEMVEQFSIILKDFDYNETERRRLFHNIQTLEGRLNNLLLISEDTSGYLYSIYDDFLDRSKVDLQNSTCEINTESGTCTLRESKNGIEKINMSHYFDIINFPLVADRYYAKNIISNTIFPNSKFGNAFYDNTSTWMQNIVSSQSGKLELSFTVDISPSDLSGVYISRIEVNAQSPNPCTIEPVWSVDNINFLKLPAGYSETSKISANGRTTVWNFSPTRIRYLRFLITKDSEDESISNDGYPAYRYVIGFKNIAIYKMAYDRESTLYSSAFTVTDTTSETLTMDKAAIVVDHDIQEKTNIKYYLSLGDTAISDPEDYNWIAVSAVNDPAPTEQQVANFSQVAFFNDVPDVAWNSSSYGTPIETYNGIGFYTVYKFPYEPVRDSVSLYRGKNDWQVEPRKKISTVQVKNEEHKFGAGSTVTLSYPNFTPTTGRGLVRGSITVKNDSGNNGGTLIFNNPGDYTVNYTTKILNRPTGSTIATDTTSQRNSVYVDYSYDKEVDLPSEYTTYIYVLNPDGLDIKILPFSSGEIENGNYTMIETDGVYSDVSAFTEYHIPPGWHAIVTTGEPGTVNDRFYSVNGNKYLHEKVLKQYAYAQQLQEVSWFELKYNTLITDHSRYAIIDYDGDGKKELVVNYRPQTSAWISGYDMLGTLLPETYNISYKFFSSITNKIYLKAVLSREEGTSPLTTPTLRSYTIKMGY